MKRGFKITRMLALMLLLCGVSYAEFFRIGLQLGAGFPQTEFKESVDKIGLGAGFTLTGNLHRNVAIGLALNLHYFGSETRVEYIPAPVTDIGVKVTRTNNLTSLCLLTQAGVDISRFKPYLECRFGINYFLWTDAEIENLVSEEIEGKANFDDIALCCAIGGGLMFNIFEKVVEPKDELKGFTYRIRIDAKALYVYGGKAGYLKEGAIFVNDEGEITYDISKSRTDMLTLQLGVMFCL